MKNIANAFASLTFVFLFFTCFLMGCSLETEEQTERPETSTTGNNLVLNEEWQARISGSPDVHLISLPPNISSFPDARVYQFGNPYKDWADNLPRGSHNMECGPASVQTIERLSGRPGVSCSYKETVQGCKKYTLVHSDCRAVGACGHVEDGFDNNSFDGTSDIQMRNVLEHLGYTVQTYRRGKSPVSLDIVKKAINADHPIIVALSPEEYCQETEYNCSIDSHYVVVVGYGPVCINSLYNSDDPDQEPRRYVYMLDPGWRLGSFVCISEECFNKALEEEYNPSTYTGIEVTRPGFASSSASATWYPRGTLLSIDGEYYYVVSPDARTGAMVLRHASPEALEANRIPGSRAIRVPSNVLSCAVLGNELDSAHVIREYRDEGTGAIYYVNTVQHYRAVFLNYASYLTYNGKDEWKDATAEEIQEWSSYRFVGELGLAPGTMVITDKPGLSTVWIVSSNEYGRWRLPIINESTANVYGYDLSKIGSDERAAARITYDVLDRIAGYEGQMLTEEMSRLCVGRMCLAAPMCFDIPSNIGGGEEDDLVGDGACGDCGSESTDSTNGTGGSASTGTGGALSTGGAPTGTCTQSALRCVSGQPSVFEHCIRDSETNTTDWMRFDCASGWECTGNTGQCNTPASAGTGGASSTGGVPATGGVETSTGGAPVSTGGVSTGGLPPTGGMSTGDVVVIATGGIPVATGGTSQTGGVQTATGGNTPTGGTASSTGGTLATGGTGGSSSEDCLDTVYASEVMACLDPSGDLFLRTDAFVLNNVPISDTEIEEGLWHVHAWYDFATSAPWWTEIDIVPAGYPGVGVATLPASLPSGLCPFTDEDGTRRHPIRIGAPYHGTFPDAGYDQFALSGSMYLCTDAQTGLVDDLPNQETPPNIGCSIAVYRTSATSDWLPAAALARAEMDEEDGLCSP